MALEELEEEAAPQDVFVRACVCVCVRVAVLCATLLRASATLKTLFSSSHCR
jgi:hypothetical protein